MKQCLQSVIILCMDALVIYFALWFGYILHVAFDSWFTIPLSSDLNVYLEFKLLYIVILILFSYEGLYLHRFDFWQESKIIVKSLFFSFIIVMAYLALTKTANDYSRFVIVMAYFLMTLFIPLTKNITKKILFKIGLWQREAKIYGNDTFIRQEIFDNPYLGFIEVFEKPVKTVFINSEGMDGVTLQALVEEKLEMKQEVLFIPIVNDYDLTQSQIYELSDSRSNLIVLNNNLNDPIKKWIKIIFDVILFILTIPLILIIIIILWFIVKKEDPKGSVFFKQKRLGKDNKVFICYKFRSMYEKSGDILKKYLENNPDEAEHYRIYHKYKNDPRITSIGSFLRKTSLDELPQIFNIFKGEMSFVGPRPYMLNEKEKVGEKIEQILRVKPGITGLWQVNGRSDVDFNSRVELDQWYIRNWNISLDIIILLKTVKVVVFRKGAH